MKKVIALALALAMIFCFAACGTATLGTSDNSNQTSDVNVADDVAKDAEKEVKEASNGESLEGKKIGFSDLNLTDEFFANMDTAMRETFTAMGMDYTVLSAEFNPVTQAENIENFITMGMDYIILFVIDAPSATDVLIRARESGAFVIVIGTILENPDAYDVCINVDQREAGHNAAVMASKWIDETFPDAADGSLQVVVFGSSATEDTTTRSNALNDLAELNSKVSIVNQYMIASGEDGNTKGQEFAEMAFMEYSDLVCIMTYGTDLGAAANEVAMRQSGLDLDKFAVFTIDTDDYVLEMLQTSADNGSVLRGTIALGDGTAYTCGQLVNGEWLDRVQDGIYHESLNAITVENVADYIS